MSSKKLYSVSHYSPLIQFLKKKDQKRFSLRKISSDQPTQQLFSETNDGMETLMHKDNLLVFSSLKEFYHPVKSHGFSIKYVVEGTEKYTMNGQSFDVRVGEYLLSNMTSIGQVEIESSKHVKGICVSIEPNILAEVVSSLYHPDTAYSDLALGQYFSSSLFLENKYQGCQTNLGHSLERLGKNVQTGNFNKEDLNKEFFINFLNVS